MDQRGATVLVPSPKIAAVQPYQFLQSGASKFMLGGFSSFFCYKCIYQKTVQLDICVRNIGRIQLVSNICPEKNGLYMCIYKRNRLRKPVGTTSNNAGFRLKCVGSGALGNCCRIRDMKSASSRGSKSRASPWSVNMRHPYSCLVKAYMCMSISSIFIQID